MAEPHDIDRHRIIAQTRAWVDRAVIGLNLCPFARSAQAAGRVRYELSEARDPGALLDDLAEALAALAAADPAEVETTLLVAPWTLDRKSTRLNSSHVKISYAVFCLKK